MPKPTGNVFQRCCQTCFFMYVGVRVAVQIKNQINFPYVSGRTHLQMTSERSEREHV